MADLPKSAKYYSDLPEEENVYDADHVFVLDNGNGARVTTEKFVDTVADKAGVHDMVSDEFDEEKEYSAGDYCIYENTLYKFTEDKEAGEWDTEIVEATTVSGEIQENTDLIDSSLTYYDRKSEIITTDSINTLSGRFFVNGNTAIMHGYFVINAGTYSVNDVLLTLPVAPKSGTMHFMGGDQNYMFPLRLNESGEVTLNNSRTFSGNQYVFSDLTFAIY